MRKALVAVALFALAGCASKDFGKAMVVTAAGLHQTAADFKLASAVFTAGCDAQPRIFKDEDCEGFKSFSERYKATFPVVRKAWEDARKVGDVASAQVVEPLLQNLITTMGKFMAIMRGGK